MVVYFGYELAWVWLCHPSTITDGIFLKACSPFIFLFWVAFHLTSLHVYWFWSMGFSFASKKSKSSQLFGMLKNSAGDETPSSTLKRPKSKNVTFGLSNSLEVNKALSQGPSSGRSDHHTAHSLCTLPTCPSCSSMSHEHSSSPRDGVLFLFTC